MSRIPAVVALLALALPLPAFAQGTGTPADRQSFWWGVSLGGGGTQLTCDICQASRDLGPSADVSFGTITSRDLRVGVELGGWTHDDEGTREITYRAGVVANLTPIPGRGLYLIGGLGWTGYRAEDFRYDAPRVSLGAGWDLPWLSRWTVGNQVVLDAASFGSLKNGDTTVVRRVGLSTVRVSVHIRTR